jgi:small subunit ribosomal protein S18
MSEQAIKSIVKFNFTDIELLTKYLDDQKRIMPRRMTELSIKDQRKLAKSVKRARILGLLPFVVQVEY